MSGPGSFTRSVSAAAGWFIRPAGGAPQTRRDAERSGSDRRAARSRAAAEPAPSIALLASGPMALRLAATVALAAAGTSGIAVVAAWRAGASDAASSTGSARGVGSEASAGGGSAVASTATAPAAPSAFALPAARRLASSLCARGITAGAVGRLVTVTLPDHETDAVDGLGRAESACGDAPFVLLLSGPRSDAWDGELVQRDAVLVHGADPLVVDLAVTRLVELGAPARALDASAAPGALVRTLAGAGLAAPGLREVRAALEASQ